MNDMRSSRGRDALSDAARLAAKIAKRSSTLEVCGTWRSGGIYATVKHWRGIEPKLRYLRQAYTLSLTFDGRSDPTGSLVAGTVVYEGHDGPGCVTDVPPRAERRGWNRNADLDFRVLMIEPETVDPELASSALAAPGSFTSHHDELLRSVLRPLAFERRRPGASVQSIYAEHAAGIATAHTARQRPARAPVSGRLPRPNLRRVVDFIEEHLHENISLAALAALSDRGIDVFARQFKSELGIPPYRYVLERRLQLAAAELIGTRKPIAEIALAVGFSSQSHFTTRFTSRFGVSPGTYRIQRGG